MNQQKVIGLLVGYIGVFFLLYLQEMYHKLYVVLTLLILGKFISGSEHSIFYVLFGFINRPNIKINGFVKPGFESVKQLYESNFQNGMEQNSQFVAYVKGEKVVDLCGSFKNQQTYTEKTLQNLYSTTKTVTSIVVAMLVDRGLLKYEEKIVKYWPEFGKFDKENITLQDVLRHEAGLSRLDEDITPEFIQTKEVKKNKIGTIIQNSKPKFNPDTPRTYHSTSRGYILNEIVRRVDPLKRTIGELVQDEIAGKLNIDIFIGVPEEKQGKIQNMVSSREKNRSWFYLQGLLPQFLRKHNFIIFICPFIDFMITKSTKSKTSFNFNSQAIRSGEIPSCNGHSNASSLAKLANIMSLGGSGLVGEQLISKKTFEKAHSEAKLEKDSGIHDKKTKFVKGGWNIYDSDTDYGVEYDSEGFVGWQGYGGSLMNWHIEKQIGLAYTMDLIDMDLSNSKALQLRAEVYKCTVKQQKNLQKKK